MLELSSLGDWEPPILMTVATDQQGVDALWEAVNEHRSHLQASGELASRRSARIQEELLEIVQRSIEHRVAMLMESPNAMKLRDELAEGKIDPYMAASRLIEMGEGD